MKQSYKKMINEVIEGIDWHKIFKFYEDKTLTWMIEKNIKGVKTHKAVIPTVTDLKDELKNILTYIIKSDIQQFFYGHWTIFWNEKMDEEEDSEQDQGSELEVIFSPIRFFIAEDNLELLDELNNEYNTTMSKDEEIEMLKVNLEEALKEERYELCAKIRDQIFTLENIALKPKSRRKTK